MTSATASAMHRARQLVAQRDTLEKQIKEVNEALMQQKGVGMDGRLIDAEGFPRDDIDVYQVRQLRHEMARLLYDHKHLTEDIQTALSELHAEAAQHGQHGAKLLTLLPFALVDDVTTGSPADKAGVKKGDLIIRYGHVDASNHRDLQAVAELTTQSEGKELLVVVERSSAGRVDLLLTPARWTGRGLLGCHVVPYST